MDIGRLSMNMANQRTQSEVGMKMLSKALDAQQLEGAGVLKMISEAPGAAQMENSVNPHIGGNFDMRV